MYSQDSFFTLSVPGQIGLVCLSGILSAIALFACWRLTQGRSPVLRLAVGLVLVFMFEWLSPQIYYTYYILLLDVPWQSVVRAPPSPRSLLRLLVLGENANLSFHARAVLGWAILLLALIRPYINVRSGDAG